MEKVVLVLYNDVVKIDAFARSFGHNGCFFFRFFRVADIKYRKFDGFGQTKHVVSQQDRGEVEGKHSTERSRKQQEQQCGRTGEIFCLRIVIIFADLQREQRVGSQRCRFIVRLRNLVKGLVVTFFQNYSFSSSFHRERFKTSSRHHGRP